MTGTTDEDEETRELFRLRDRLEEYRREVERRDEYLRGADVDIKEARAEVERLRRDLAALLEAAMIAIKHSATLTAERDRLKASNEGIAASLEAQVEAARKDERDACARVAATFKADAGRENDIAEDIAAAIRARSGK